MIGAWSGAHPESALAAYLLGKSEMSRGYDEQAAKNFDVVLAAPADASDLTPRIRREALRQRAVCACATNDVEAQSRVRALAEGDPRGVYAGSAERTTRQRLAAFSTRCTPH